MAKQSDSPSTSNINYLCPVCNRTATGEKCIVCGIGTAEQRKAIDERRYPKWVWILPAIATGLQAVLLVVALADAVFGDGNLDLVFVFLFSIVAIGVIVIVFYVQRLHLRQRELLRRVKAKKGIGLTTIALVSVFAAICLVALATLIVNGCGTVIAQADFPPSLGEVLRLFAGLSYAGFFPLMVLAIMAVGTNSLIEKLDRDCPRPIFLDEVTLVKVAYDALAKQLKGQIQTGSAGAQAPGAPRATTSVPVITEKSTQLERISMERTPSGGLKLTVRRRFTEPEWNDRTQKSVEKEKYRDYVAETNEWGSIVSLRENHARKSWEGGAR